MVNIQNVSNSNFFNLSNDSGVPCATAVSPLICMACIAAGLTIVVENALLLATVRRGFKSPTLVARSYVFLSSLAVADTLVGLLSLSLGVSQLVVQFDDRVSSSSPGHSIIFTLSVQGIRTVVSLSGTHMAVIALDRYVYIIHPFLYRRYVTSCLVVVTITGCWVMTLSVMTLPSVYLSGGIVCDVRENNWTPILTVTFTYIVVVILTFVAYFMIFRQVRKLGRTTYHLKHQRLKMAQSHGSTKSNVQRIAKKIVSGRKKSLTSKRKLSDDSDTKTSRSSSTRISPIGKSLTLADRAKTLSSTSTQVSESKKVKGQRQRSASREVIIQTTVSASKTFIDPTRELPRSREVITQKNAAVGSGEITCRRLPHSDLTATLKSLRFLLIVFGLFICCSLPSTVAIVVNKMKEINVQVFNGLAMLAVVHSAINFPVLVIMDTNFRLELKKLFRDLKC